MRNRIMIFLFGSLFVCSCTQKIYIRYSNLHHATQNQIIEFNNDSLFCIIQSKDTIIYKEKGLKSDYISSGKFKMLPLGTVSRFQSLIPHSPAVLLSQISFNG